MTELEQNPPTLKCAQRLGLLLAILLAVVAIDQASKVYATKHWQGAGVQSYFHDVFHIIYKKNEGAFLSLGSQLGKTARFWLLTVFNGVMLGALTVYILRTRIISFWPFVAWSLIISGGVGNLIDRVRFEEVIDFFNLGIGGLRTGIFNVADMAITAGFLMILPLLFLSERRARQQPAASESAPQGAPLPPS